MKNDNTRNQAGHEEPLFRIDLPDTLDFELDFDIGDFQLVSPGESIVDDSAPQENVRILKPRLDVKTVSHNVLFENAEQFAKQIDLTPGSRTFAWISGSFIFGDIIEALITARSVGIKKLYITSLSFSQENIDSLKNVQLIMGHELERMVLIFSGYQYSHEKYGLVPYMYQELDDSRNRVQIAFGGWHNKIITMETVHGHTITIHGSANMRSSNSIEQIMVEIDDRDLHQFNVDLMERIAEYFGTINYNAPRQRLHRIEGKEAWELSMGRISAKDL